MKALKSALAKTVLADPSARVQLRSYLASKNAKPTISAAVGTISLHSEQEGTVLYRLEVVPKAA